MALEPDFLDMAEDTVVHASLTTDVNVYGSPDYSTATVTYQVHLEWGDHLVVTPSGKEEVASCTIYVMSSSAQIGVQDLITLSSGETPRLLRVDNLTDDEGLHHVEVHI